MRWGSYLAESLRPIVDLVYPPRCPLCGDAIAAQVGLCVDCWDKLDVPSEPACPTCQKPMGHSAAAQFNQCLTCTLKPPRHAGIFAATIYNDASRQLILNYKHGGKINLARLLGQLMAGRIPLHEGAGPLLVPVPLHRWRIWSRGFNQAALLARELERHGKGELLVDALVRTKRTPSLGGLGKDQRNEALNGAIAVRKQALSKIKGRDIILVDDVLTSGATSNACVTALRDAGAASVKITCFARVVESPEMGSDSMSVPKNETPEAIKAPGAT